MPSTIGIDIGGSSVKAVTRDEGGLIVERYESPGSPRGGAQVAAGAIAALRRLDTSGSVGVGVGVPGQVDPATGRVSQAVNLGIEDPYDLAAEIESEAGMPVTLENDVRAAALGAYEHLSMTGRVVQSLAVVSIGTGISAGVVVDGWLLRGARGMAGEVGHVVVDDSGPVCRCGQRGCLEGVAAGPAIGKAWPKGDADAAATALFTSAAAGDPAALRVAGRVTGHLTTALGWLAAAYDTEVILLTGGVASVGDDFLEIVHRQIVERAAVSELAARRLRPEQVILADPMELLGARGAALLAIGHSLPERVSPASKKASSK